MNGASENTVQIDPEDGLTKRAPLISAQARRFGIYVGIGGAILVVIVLANAGIEAFDKSDGKYFRLVGENPFGDGSAFVGADPRGGVAYRYGRLTYSLAAWLLAGGQAGLVRWTLPIVSVLALGLMAACAAELIMRRGGTVENAIKVLLVPGIPFCLSISYSEIFVMALMLLAILLHVDGRMGSSQVAGAVLMLARESAGLILLPLAIADIRRRRGQGLLWSLVPMPLMVWWWWVSERVGQWPFLDPSISRKQALSWPGGGMFRVLGEGGDVGQWIVSVIIVATAIASIWIARRYPWPPVTTAGAISGLLVLCLGPIAVRFPGEAMRLLVPAQVFVAMALISRNNAKFTEPARTL